MTEVANCAECLAALARTPCEGGGRHERIVDWDNHANRKEPRSTEAIMSGKNSVVVSRHRWCGGCRTGHVRDGKHELELQVLATEKYGNPPVA